MGSNRWTQRKPSEVVAEGLMLEAPLLAENKVRRAAAISEVAKLRRRGADGLFQPNQTVRVSKPQQRNLVPYVVVARQLGIDPGSYRHARAVTLAARAEPERYGDLVAQMDRTRQPGAAYAELKRRQRGDIDPRRQERSTQAFRNALDGLDAVVSSLEVVDGAHVLPSALPDGEEVLSKLIARLVTYRRVLRSEQRKETM